MLGWSCRHGEGLYITQAVGLILLVHEAISLSLPHLTEQEGNSLHLLPLSFI